jgi:hypothetical protein
MTGAEWLACEDLGRIRELLPDDLSERRKRLCAVAWARSVLRHAPVSPRAQRHAHWFDARDWAPQLDATEQFADGQIDRKALRAARTSSGGPWNFFLDVARASHFSLDAVLQSLYRVEGEFGIPPASEVCDLVRDITGNPFRRIEIPTGCISSTAVAIAQAVYGDLDFARLPVLADALLDAGYEVPEVIDHCRSPGPHVRGCWVVDFVLGKG